MEILPVPLYDTWMGFQTSVEKLVDKPFTNIYEYLSIYQYIYQIFMNIYQYISPYFENYVCSVKGAQGFV